MDTIPLIPCPHCKAEAVAKEYPAGTYYVGCSNELDCNIWPVTHTFDSSEAAATAWNAWQTF